MKLIVETVDLRLALRSVTPHADPDKDFPQLHRVRCEIGGENVTVSATNRYTIGHALVSIWDNIDGELGAFDLSPTDVKEILALFPGKASSDDEPGQTVQIEVTDEHITVTDVSGLFPGKALTLPRYPMGENFPDVAKMIQAKLTTRGAAAERLITSGQLVALFTKAAIAYGQPLVLDPAGEAGAILITCGESFVGVLMPQRPNDETTDQITRWHNAWYQRMDDRLPVGAS